MQIYLVYERESKNDEPILLKIFKEFNDAENFITGYENKYVTTCHIDKRTLY